MEQAVRDLVSEGALSSSDAAAMSSTTAFLRTYADVLQSLAAAQDEWETRDARRCAVPHPAWDTYAAGGLTAEELGGVYARFWRAVFEPGFVGGLAATRGQKWAGEAVERLFGRVAELYGREPVPLVQPFAFLWLVRK